MSEAEQTYPNAGPNCDLGRYRTGETPMVGDVVRMHAESVERVGSPAVQYAAMIGKDATVVDSTFTGAVVQVRCEEGLDAAFAARFDLIRRADHSPDAGKMVEPDRSIEFLEGLLLNVGNDGPTLLEAAERVVWGIYRNGKLADVALTRSAMEFETAYAIGYRSNTAQAMLLCKASPEQIAAVERAKGGG